MFPKKIIVLGCGYIGTSFALAAQQQGIQVTAIVREKQHDKKLHALGITSHIAPSPEEVVTLLQEHDALLDSIPLSSSSHASQCDWLPKIQQHLQHMKWIAYLSSSSVYGDHQGAWVTEDSVCQHTSQRGKQRLKAEHSWKKTYDKVRIFRLSGIYGPQRNILNRLKSGEYKALCLPNFSNRIHRDDIVASLLASLHHEKHSSIINISDDEPLAHHQYVCEIARIAQLPQPEIIPEAQASSTFSKAYLDFFRDNKRLSNQRLHQELLPTLKYPSFRDAPWQ